MNVSSAQICRVCNNSFTCHPHTDNPSYTSPSHIAHDVCFAAQWYLTDRIFIRPNFVCTFRFGEKIGKSWFRPEKWPNLCNEHKLCSWISSCSSPLNVTLRNSTSAPDYDVRVPAAGGCYTTEEQRSRRNQRDEYHDRRMSTGTAQLVAVADASLKYCYLHDPLAALSGGSSPYPAANLASA